MNRWVRVQEKNNRAQKLDNKHSQNKTQSNKVKNKFIFLFTET